LVDACHVCDRVLTKLNLQMMNRTYINPEQAVRLDNYRCLDA